MQGVEQSNVIPSSARALLDVRLTPGPDEAAVAREIDLACRQAMARCPGSTIEWEPVNGFRLATRVERSEPLVRAMVAGVRQATGRRAVFGGVPGSTDGTILRMQLGIPIVTCGPGHRLIPHQADEYVEVAELVDAAKIYVASALNFLEMSETVLRLRAVESFPVEHEGRSCIACVIPAATPTRSCCSTAPSSRSCRSSTVSTRSPTSRPR